MSAIRLALVFLLASVFCGCRKEEKYPIIPALTYKSVNLYAKNSFYIITSFTDGDGDIGLTESDTIPPYDKNSKYYHNYFCTFYQLQNGTWQELNFSIPYNYRIPLLTPKQRNKNIKGDIQVDIKGFISPISNGIADTIRVEVYVADRALHESNKVFTDQFVILK